MSELIGIPELPLLLRGNQVTFNAMKRHLLLFDRLGFHSLSGFLVEMESNQSISASAFADVEYLRENELIFEFTQLTIFDVIPLLPHGHVRRHMALLLQMLDYLPTDKSIKQIVSNHADLSSLTHEELCEEHPILLNMVMTAMDDYFTKQAGRPLLAWKKLTNIQRGSYFHLLSHFLSHELKAEAFPVYQNGILSTESTEVSNAEVLRIVLNSMPIPTEETSWQQILDFKSDPSSKSKFIALRHWMHEVARAQLKPHEIEVKLQYLLDDYQQHFRLHKMKTTTGKLETVLTLIPGVAGDLLSLRWGDAAQSLFKLRKGNLQLMESELALPSREIAYIARVREEFE